MTHITFTIQDDYFVMCLLMYCSPRIYDFRKKFDRLYQFIFS